MADLKISEEIGFRKSLIPKYLKPECDIQNGKSVSAQLPFYIEHRGCMLGHNVACAPLAYTASLIYMDAAVPIFANHT